MTSIEFPRRPVAFILYTLKNMSARHKFLVLAMMLIMALIVIGNLCMVYGFQLLVDRIPTSDNQHVWKDLAYPFGIVAVGVLFHTVMYRIRDICNALVVPDLLSDLRERVFYSVLDHSHEYFHNRFAGELANKINNLILSFREIFLARINEGVIPIVAATISSFILLWFVDSSLSWILIGVVSLVMMCSYGLGKMLGRASAHLADAESDISGQLVDAMTNVSSIKIFARKRHEISLLRDIHRPYIGAYRQYIKQQIIFWGSFDIIMSGFVLGFIWYLIAHKDSNSYSAGDIAVCVLVAWDMWWRMGIFSWHLTQLSGDLGRMQSALNEFVVPIGVQDPDNAVELTVPHGQITFDRMGFTYQSGHRVFDDFQLVIPPAQKIGIVGLSGAGKTTLCHLLMRNYDVTSGTIAIDGQDIAGVTQDSLRRNIAVIPQDPSLFHRSLYENILYGRPEASEAEVMAAAKAAQAHDFILATPHGYNTLVGERGIKLSGGQRQRIAIARAILKDAPILILDEATSALDSDTERLIQTALDTAMQGRTTLVVAHRLSTLAHMDRLIVMQNGRIVEDGTQAELMALKGAFAHLWSLQAGGFLPHKI